jgi:hypothetical protein
MRIKPRPCFRLSASLIKLTWNVSSRHWLVTKLKKWSATVTEPLLGSAILESRNTRAMLDFCVRIAKDKKTQVTRI